MAALCHLRVAVLSDLSFEQSESAADLLAEIRFHSRLTISHRHALVRAVIIFGWSASWGRSCGCRARSRYIRSSYCRRACPGFALRPHPLQILPVELQHPAAPSGCPGCCLFALIITWSAGAATREALVIVAGQRLLMFVQAWVVAGNTNGGPGAYD
jgi:hypothetical protein